MRRRFVEAEKVEPERVARLLGMNVEIFRSSASETEGCKSLLERAKKRYRYRPKALGADKGYFSEGMIDHLRDRRIAPHIAPLDQGQQPAHEYVRKHQHEMGYKLSQRCRKRIEELLGVGKEYHEVRRFRRRGRLRVGGETWMIAWVLNLERLAKILEPAPATI